MINTINYVAEIFFTKNKVSGEESFSIISRHKMILSVTFYERNNIIFYEKNLKYTINITFNNVFCNIVESVIIIAFEEFLKNYCIFINHMTYLSGKIFSKTPVFPILIVKFSAAKIIKRIFFNEKFIFIQLYTMIFFTYIEN